MEQEQQEGRGEQGRSEHCQLPAHPIALGLPQPQFPLMQREKWVGVDPQEGH